MQKGDIVLLSFTGREANTGGVFDTTDKQLAEMSGIRRPGGKYGAVPVIVGNGELLPGIEEALAQMGVGEKLTLELSPEKAFGERKKELIAIVPLREFHKRQIRPLPGLIVDVNGNYGKVQTVSGGRVRVDFNTDLAGKKVIYDVKIEKQLTKPEEKVDALFGKYFPVKNSKCRFDAAGSRVVVSVPMGLPKEFKILSDAFCKVLKEHVPEAKNVKFEETEPPVKEGDVKMRAEETGMDKNKPAAGNAESKEGGKGEAGHEETGPAAGEEGAAKRAEGKEKAEPAVGDAESKVGEGNVTEKSKAEAEAIEKSRSAGGAIRT